MGNGNMTKNNEYAPGLQMAVTARIVTVQSYIATPTLGNT